MDFFKLLAKPFLSLALPTQKEAQTQEDLLSRPHKESRNESTLQTHCNLLGSSDLKPLVIPNSNWKEAEGTTGRGMLPEAELITKTDAKGTAELDISMEASCSSTQLPPIRYSTSSHPLHPLPLRPNTNPPLTTRTSKLSYKVASSSTTSSSARLSALSPAHSTSSSRPIPIGNHSASSILGSAPEGRRVRSPSPSTRAKVESERDAAARKRAWSRSRDTRASVDEGGVIRARDEMDGRGRRISREEDRIEQPRERGGPSYFEGGGRYYNPSYSTRSRSPPSRRDLGPREDFYSRDRRDYSPPRSPPRSNQRSNFDGRLIEDYYAPRNDRPRSRSPEPPRFQRRSRSPPSHRSPPPLLPRDSYSYRFSGIEAQPRREEVARSTWRFEEERGRGRSREEHSGRERSERPSRQEYTVRIGSVRPSAAGSSEVKVERDEASEVLGLELGDGDASMKPTASLPSPADSFSSLPAVVEMDQPSPHVSPSSTRSLGIDPSSFPSHPPSSSFDAPSLLLPSKPQAPALDDRTFVAKGIPRSTSARELKNLFSAYGIITAITIELPTGKESRGKAYITFE